MEKKILYLSTYIGKDRFYQEQRNLNSLVLNVDLIDGKKAFNKILLGIGYYICPQVLYALYGSWKKEVGKYEIIIIDSRRASKYAVLWIKKKYPGIRVIVWYWNQVSKAELNPNFCKKNGCEVWSFDRKDCKKYGMNFNDQYYFSYLDEEKEDIDYDVYYLGKWTQERENEIEKLSDIMRDKKLNFRYKLVRYRGERVDYKQYIKEIKRSKGILELNKQGQDGLTLRALESLFYKKKLITNNKSICKEKIYKKENIFVIGIDDYDTLKDFLETDYLCDECYDDLIQYYKFDGWVDRLVKE